MAGFLLFDLVISLIVGSCAESRLVAGCRSVAGASLIISKKIVLEQAACYCLRSKGSTICLHGFAGACCSAHAVRCRAAPLQ